MQLIIPDYDARAHEVFVSVGSCKGMLLTIYSVASLNSNTMVVARFIFDSIQKANRSRLTEYSNATHISQYLFNPWIGVFLPLRDLLSLGETRKIKANTDASQPLEYQASRDRERKLENMSEQLLHRFMEVTLVLFSIICGGRDEFRRCVVTTTFIPELMSDEDGQHSLTYRGLLSDRVVQIRDFGRRLYLRGSPN
jgi:hypothetical protein